MRQNTMSQRQTKNMPSATFIVPWKVSERVALVKRWRVMVMDIPGKDRISWSHALVNGWRVMVIYICVCVYTYFLVRAPVYIDLKCPFQVEHWCQVTYPRSQAATFGNVKVHLHRRSKHPSASPKPSGHVWKCKGPSASPIHGAAAVVRVLLRISFGNKIKF